MSYIDSEVGRRSQEDDDRGSPARLAMELAHGPQTLSPLAVTCQVRAMAQNPLDKIAHLFERKRNPLDEIAHLFKKQNDHEPTPPPDQDFDSAA